MFENLHVNDDVKLTLRDKTVAQDRVVSIDRDGTVRFEKLGYRYRSGMEFHDHLSKLDVVEIEVVGASSKQPDDEGGEPQLDVAATMEHYAHVCAENAELKKKIADLEFEIEALRDDKPAGPAEPEKTERDSPKADKETGKENENKPTGETGNSSETGTATDK